MFASPPTTAREFMDWPWPRIEPYYHDLRSRTLTAQNMDTWLADWSRLINLMNESYWRLYILAAQAAGYAPRSPPPRAGITKAKT